MYAPTSLASLALILASCAEPNPSPTSADNRVGTTSAALVTIGTIPVINVKDAPYNAKGDSTTFDDAAIQAAINDAVNAGGGGPYVVYFPSGHYRLGAPLKPSATYPWHNLTFLGTRNSFLRIDPATGTSTAITVDRDTTGLKIRHLGVEEPNDRCPDDNGLIQLVANVLDFTIEDVQVFGWGAFHTPPGTLPTHRCDGIALSGNTRGTLRNVVVAGASKAGIYINGSTSGGQANHVTVEGCEVRSSWGPASISPQAGILVNGADSVTISHTRSWLNQGPGLFVGINGDNSPIGTPSTNIDVIGGQFDNNGRDTGAAYDYRTGVYVGALSGFTSMPKNIQLSAIRVRKNAGSGINIESGANIRLSDSVLSENGESGAWLHRNATYANTQNISLINTLIYNNSQNSAGAASAIKIDSVSPVTISGGRIYDEQTGQANRISLLGSAAIKLRLMDVEIETANYGTPFDFASQPASLGHFRIQFDGSPENVVYAPIGSEYVDLTSGTSYKKTSAYSSKTGWKAVQVAP